MPRCLLLSCLPVVALLFAGPAVADREFSGQDRFDLERPDVQQWVEKTAKERSEEAHV